MSGLSLTFAHSFFLVESTGRSPSAKVPCAHLHRSKQPLWPVWKNLSLCTPASYSINPRRRSHRLPIPFLIDPLFNHVVKKRSTVVFATARPPSSSSSGAKWFPRLCRPMCATHPSPRSRSLRQNQPRSDFCERTGPCRLELLDRLELLARTRGVGQYSVPSSALLHTQHSN